MATAAVSSSAGDVNDLLTDSLHLVDLRLLSQSELLSLSLSSATSSSSSSLNCSSQNEADVATLKIDRSVFNESAGSRKQTFYRLRLAPPRSNNNLQLLSTRRNFEFLKSEEDSQISDLLKSLFGSNSHSIENNKEDEVNLLCDDNLISVPVTCSESLEALQNSGVASDNNVGDSTQKKRKRGRPRKDLSKFGGNYSVNTNDVNVVNEEKQKLAIVVYDKESVIIESKRKRGRPRKNVDVNHNNNNNNNNVVAAAAAADANVNVNKRQVVSAEEIGKKMELSGGIVNLEDSGMKGECSGKKVESSSGIVSVEESEKKVESSSGIVSVVDSEKKVESSSDIVNVESGSGKKVKSSSGIVSVEESGKKVEPSSGKKVGSSGGKEEWFGEELRTMTAGLQTEAEVLGFFEALEGEWMSKRKKRKIVDASLLGDLLPRGWKVMVCNKRRAGFFWLACTGYISPNGQQFMSCKEVSSYLLSKELKDSNQSNFVHVDGSVRSAEMISFGDRTTPQAADIILQDKNDGDDLISSPTLPVTDSVVEQGKQAANLAAVVPGQVKKVEKFKCHKCTLAFEEPDGLLQHLLSSHHKTPKSLGRGALVTEEAIMKNGKYECQFCQKTFEERRRFNGHLGNHIKDYFKRIGGSGVVKTVQSGTPSIAVHSGVVEMQESNRLDAVSDAIRSSIETNAEINSVIPSCNIKENMAVESYCGKQDKALSLVNGKAEKTNGVIEVGVVNTVCSGSEPVLSNNDNSSICRPLNEKTLCTADRLNTTSSHEESSQNCSLAAGEKDRTCVTDTNNDLVITSSIDEHNQKRDSGSCLLAFKSSEKPFVDENSKVGLLFGRANDEKLDEKDFIGKGEQNTGFGNYCSSQRNVAANVMQQKSSECSSEQRYGSVSNMDGISTPVTAERTLVRGSYATLSSSVDEKSSLWSDKMNQGSSSTTLEPRINELGNSRNDVRTFGFGNNRTVSSHETKSSFRSCSVIPSWNEQVHFAENNMNETQRSTSRISCQEKKSEGRQLTLFGDAQSLGVKVSNCMSGVAKHDEAQYSKNSDHRTDVNLAAGPATDVEMERSANKFSLGLSGNELTFSINDKWFLNGTSKASSVDARNPESGLNRQSCEGQNLNKVNNMNMNTYITASQHKNKEVKSSYNAEPCFAFPRSRAEQNADIVKNTVEENCLKDSSLLISGNQQTFAMEDNDIDLYCSSLDEPKRAFMESLFCFSRDELVPGVENNTNNNQNIVSTDKFQQKPRLDDLYPGKNESVFGLSTHSQASENASSDFMWRTDEENDLLSGFADTSSQFVHSSGCFPSYDVVSNKGESELFGQKFSAISGFEGPRSSSMGNMEYNFMIPHSGEKVFTYGSNVAQGFNSSAWHEKEAMPLLPKITSRHRAFCVWCRDEIHYEALKSDAQVGSAGLTCTACKAKFSGQFNLL